MRAMPRLARHAKVGLEVNPMLRVAKL